jgi:excisionase family DNA binding protein
MQDSQLLTTNDAAKIIGVSSETIRLWESCGKLPAQRTASGQRLFRRDDIERAATDYRGALETRSLRR